MLNILIGFAGLLLIALVLLDSFETILLPRRVAGRLRFSGLFIKSFWLTWRAIARRIKSEDRQQYMLSYFGPLSLLMLLAAWAVVIILGFALLQWSVCVPVIAAGGHQQGLETYLYMSGITFFTVGYGDVVPSTSAGHFVAVIEAGVGLAMLALVVGYLPVIYQAFSRRETTISLLDAHAGSPPSAGELLIRHSENREELTDHLHEWEQWSAEVLESHLSYPFLMYYRSQHENQSWLAMLTTILDSCALLLTGIEGTSEQTARFTFAIARHAVVDLTHTTNIRQRGKATPQERLTSEDFAQLQALLNDNGVLFRNPETAEQRLQEIRALYEPYLFALSRRLMLALPHWLPSENIIDDWETSAWDHLSKQALISRVKHDKIHYKKKHASDGITHQKRRHVEGVTH